MLLILDKELMVALMLDGIRTVISMVRDSWVRTTGIALRDNTHSHVDIDFKKLIH